MSSVCISWNRFPFVPSLSPGLEVWLVWWICFDFWPSLALSRFLFMSVHVPCSPFLSCHVIFLLCSLHLCVFHGLSPSLHFGFCMWVLAVVVLAFVAKSLQLADCAVAALRDWHFTGVCFSVSMT